MKHWRKRVCSHKIIKIVKTKINQHFIELRRLERNPLPSNLPAMSDSWAQKHITHRDYKTDLHIFVF